MKTNQLTPQHSSLSFRAFMRAELARRCNRNRQYSLRAFAKFLDMDHSTLSQLMRGKRRLTERTIRRCGIRIGLDEQSVAEFVEAEARRGTNDDDHLVEVRRLADDTASILSEWQHYAILELTRLRDFRADSRWIARVLDLTVDDVNVAVQRLLRLGLLSMDSPTRWTDVSGNTAASIRCFTQSALQHLVEQARRRLFAALDSHASDSIAFRATTLAIDAKRIPEALKRIEKFHEEITALLSTNSDADTVYQFDLSLVPLTRTKKED